MRARAGWAPHPRRLAPPLFALGLALATLSLPSRLTPVLLALAAAVVAPCLRGGGAATLPLAVALGALALGLTIGGARIAAVDGSALHAAPGSSLRVEGHLLAPPRRRAGRVRLLLATSAGRVAVETPEPVPDLSTGRRLAAAGVVRAPPVWLRAHLRRQGVRRVLAAHDVRPLPGGRPGVLGVLDGARARSLAALGAGLPEREAGLLRGFVLGADDAIDERTRTHFNRSGLAHLLAVSGQNVALLAALALPAFALAGLSLRGRYAAVLALIAVYVPLAGGGPSIQRAGVMAAAGIAALLASRPAARWHALFLAAALTLLLNPLAAGDPGWQLSFAAVAGIALTGGPIRRAVLALTGTGNVRGALAEGVALTLAATTATAPLMALHFEVLSLAALPANIAALPAVAPVMWLGMLAAALAQIPLLPPEPITVPAGALAAYIAEVARAFARPSWASIPVSPPAPVLAASTIAIALLASTATRAISRRSSAGALRLRLGAALTLLFASSILTGRQLLAGPVSPVPAGALARIEVLDIGQGDAILLRPRGAAPVLIDAGPPGAGLPDQLRQREIGRLGLLVVTHADLDHAGGAPELLRELRVDAVALARPAPPVEIAARAAGAHLVSLSEGDNLRSGYLRLHTLWPPPAEERRAVAQGEPENAASIVFLASLGRFRMLLTGDAEHELTALDPGPVDVLKVAHHGSDDAGLAPLLSTASPRLALISVGRRNRYGHPTPAVLRTLRRAGVSVRRTDREGTIALDVMPRRFSASALG